MNSSYNPHRRRVKAWLGAGAMAGIGLACLVALPGAGGADVNDSVDPEADIIVIEPGASLPIGPPAPDIPGFDIPDRAPRGMQLVSDSSGRNAGMMPELSLATFDAFGDLPWRELPNGLRRRSLVVTDGNGNVTGYHVEDLAFVDLATASSRQAMLDLEEAERQRVSEHADELQALLDELAVGTTSSWDGGSD